jgi:hypothetical protein
MSGTSAEHKTLPNAPHNLPGPADRLPPSEHRNVRYLARKLTLMPPIGRWSCVGWRPVRTRYCQVPGNAAGSVPLTGQFDADAARCFDGRWQVTGREPDDRLAVKVLRAPAERAGAPRHSGHRGVRRPASPVRRQVTAGGRTGSGRRRPCPGRPARRRPTARLAVAPPGPAAERNAGLRAAPGPPRRCDTGACRSASNG